MLKAILEGFNTELENTYLLQVATLSDETWTGRLLFLFVCHILLEKRAKEVSNASNASREKEKNYAHDFLIVCIRAFGSYGIILPIMIGKMPSPAWRHVDEYICVWTPSR